MLFIWLKRFYYSLRYGLRKSLKESARPLLDCWQNENLKPSTMWKNVEYLVVDTETSSLNPSEGEILSIGWVIIKDGKSLLSSSEHFLLKPKNSVGKSATIHQLRDCELEQGLSERDIMNRFLSVAKGRVLIFHHAPLDTRFLNKISRRLYGLPLVWPIIDTMAMETHILNQKNVPIGKSVLRLASCRARYNLPSYPAHNALVDALATAELFLAQMAYRNGNFKLRDLF